MDNKFERHPEPRRKSIIAREFHGDGFEAMFESDGTGSPVVVEIDQQAFDLLQSKSGKSQSLYITQFDQEGDCNGN